MLMMREMAGGSASHRLPSPFAHVRTRLETSAGEIEMHSKYILKFISRACQIAQSTRGIYLDGNPPMRTPDYVSDP